MAGSKRNRKSVEIPLLKAYLRSTPSYPSYVPDWITPAAWGVFIVSAIGLSVLGLECIGIIASIGLAMITSFLLRSNFKPRSDAEKADEVMYGSIRKLKRYMEDMGFNKRMPAEVLYALEEAVATHNSVVAKLSVEDPVHAVERSKPIQQSLHACIHAAVSVSRDDDHSKKEWNAILENKQLTAEIVETIHLHTARMRSPNSWDVERIAALRELDDHETHSQLRLGD